MFCWKLCNDMYLISYIYQGKRHPGYTRTGKPPAAAGLGLEGLGPYIRIDSVYLSIKSTHEYAESIVMWAESFFLIGLWNRSLCGHDRLS